MKQLSFYNGKGGVGKTTLTEMFASWLRYSENTRVLVLDFEEPNSRIQQERDKELGLLKDESSVLFSYIRRNPCDISPYEIVHAQVDDADYSIKGLVTFRDRIWDYIESVQDKYDYVLFDFPAGFHVGSLSYSFLMSGICDFIVVPVDTTSITCLEGLQTARYLLSNEQKVVMLWNRVTVDEINREGYLEAVESTFKDFGFDFLPHRIKSFQRARRDSDSNLFVKSTLCWPQKYVELACPQLIELFRDMKGRLERL